MIKIVDKVWGREEWLVNNELYCAKFLYLKINHRCSLHYHAKKDETFYVLEGVVYIETIKSKNMGVDKQKLILQKGDSIRIARGVTHRFTGLAPSKILEVSTTHEDSDSYRFELSGVLTK